MFSSKKQRQFISVHSRRSNSPSGIISWGWHRPTTLLPSNFVKSANSQRATQVANFQRRLAVPGRSKLAATDQGQDVTSVQKRLTNTLFGQLFGSPAGEIGFVPIGAVDKSKEPKPTDRDPGRLSPSHEQVGLDMDSGFESLGYSAELARRDQRCTRNCPAASVQAASSTKPERWASSAKSSGVYLCEFSV